MRQNYQCCIFEKGEKDVEQRKKAIIRSEGRTGKQFRTTNGTVTALDDINLEILQGEIFGIIGLSFWEKSTLVRCINYLETPTADGFLRGQNLSMKESEIRKARQSMGMIFQQFNLLAQRNVLQNVCFPMEIAGVPKAEAKKRADELLKLVGLEETDEGISGTALRRTKQLSWRLHVRCPRTRRCCFAMRRRVRSTRIRQNRFWSFSRRLTANSALL